MTIQTVITNDERRISSRISAQGWVVDNSGNAAKLLDLSKEGARIEFVGLDDFDLDINACTIMPMMGIKKSMGVSTMWERRTDKPGGLEVGLSFDKPLSFYAS